MRIHPPNTNGAIAATAVLGLAACGDDGNDVGATDAPVPATEDEAHDLELWLIATDADGQITDVQPVSLVDATRPGTYAVPAGLSPDVYSVVDISIEPRDGDERHPGRSILRGTLDV